jgi:hypothetical protein
VCVYRVVTRQIEWIGRSLACGHTGRLSLSSGKPIDPVPATSIANASIHAALEQREWRSILGAVHSSLRALATRLCLPLCLSWLQSMNYELHYPGIVCMKHSWGAFHAMALDKRIPSRARHDHQLPPPPKARRRIDTHTHTHTRTRVSGNAPKE